MKENSNSELKILADEIREQAAQLKVQGLLSFLYTADIVNRYLDVQLTEFPIGRTGFGILHHLILHSGKMTPTDISKRIFRSPHAVTRAVDTLKKLGFVKRGSTSSDRRVRYVSITKKGLEFIKESMHKGQRGLLQSVFLLNKNQIEELLPILRQVRKDTLKLIDNYTSMLRL